MSDEENLPDVDWSQLEDDSLPPGVTHNILTEDMLAKRLLWDVTPCDEAVDVADFLQLAPASEDVEEMEHKESHGRLVGAMPLLPILRTLTYHAARAAVASMFVGVGDEGGPETPLFQEAVAKQYPVMFAANWAVVGELLDMGLLHLPHGGLFYAGDMNEEDVE